MEISLFFSHESPNSNVMGQCAHKQTHKIRLHFHQTGHHSEETVEDISEILINMYCLVSDQSLVLY